MQVIGRLMMLASEKRVSVFSLCCVSFISMFLLVVNLFGKSFIWINNSFCCFSRSQLRRFKYYSSTVISGLLGRNDFGIISGLLAVGFVLGSALAPLLGSLVWQLGTYDLVIFVALLLPAFALALLIGAWRHSRNNQIMLFTEIYQTGFASLCCSSI